jgi:hypothetical protein
MRFTRGAVGRFRAGFAAGVDMANRTTPLQFLEHDPEKCEAVFRKDHAQTKS